VNQNEASGLDLWEEAANFALSDIDAAVAEEDIDRFVDVYLQAGRVVTFDPTGHARGSDILFRPGKDQGIVLDRDDFSKAIGLEALGHFYGAVADERSGFEDYIRLERYNQGFEKVEDFNFCALRVNHLPTVGIGAFGRWHDVL